MKVPSPTQGRTRVAQSQQAYTQSASNPGAGLAYIGKGMNSLASSVSAIEARFEQRAEQTDKFNTLKSFSEFQTQTAERLTELKRNYSADGKGYAKTAEDVYGEMESKWLETVPEDFQAEFRYRSQEARRGIVGDSLSFQYQAGDAWFKQGVADELTKSKGVLDQNPAALKNEQARIYEIIQATDLPENQKQELARQATISLEKVTYKAEVRKDPSVRASLGVGDPISVVDRIIGVESSGDPSAVPRDKSGKLLSSAAGLGQFINSTWLNMLAKYRPDIQGTREELLALKTDPALSREMTTRYVEENSDALSRAGITPSNGNVYLAHFLGPADAIKVLRASPDTPVEGMVNSDSVAANRSVLAGKTAGEVRSWANKKMGSATLATDPRFANIPYEDKVALYEDAERDVSREAAQQAALAKAQRDAQQNQLYLGLLDGKSGQMDIDEARLRGVLDDYDSVHKAQEILRKRDEEQNLTLGTYAKLASGAPFDPTDPDDKKGLNAVVKQGNGLQRLAAGDTNYVSDSLVPLANQVGDIPTDVAGTLMGMVRGADNNKAMFALDALAQLRDATGIGFNQRVSEDVAKQVDLWDTMKDFGNRDEILSTVRGGTTQAERQQREVLRKEGQNILTRTEDGVAKGETLLADAIGKFGGTFWSAQVAAPVARQSLAKEFNALFIDAYSKTGDETKASELAVKSLERNWGVTSVGGGKDLMKYPPEKVGYRAINGSYNWIDRQVRKELGQPQFPEPAGLSPQETALLQYSRDNMLSGNVIEKDGDLTSVYITGVTGPDGRIYNVPGYADGKMLTDEEALVRANAAGLDKYPSYATGTEADRAAEKVHRFIDKDIAMLRQSRDAFADYDLFSDEQTRQEFQAYQKDVNSAPPSYRVFLKDASGVYRERTDANGLPLRMNFKPDQATLDAEARAFDRRDRIWQLQETLDNYYRIREAAQTMGQEVSPEDTEDFNAAQSELDQLQNSRAMEPGRFQGPDDAFYNLTPGGL
jgi:hypothetical protein